ncbi:MAG: GlsB/YeaQ/YmgE family stress response membrane protein [Bacteroidota bacterium]
MVLILWIGSGMVAGWLAGLMVRGNAYGALADLILGLVGGLGGGFLASSLQWQTAAWPGQALVGALGGAILVWMIHLIHPGTVRA